GERFMFGPDEERNNPLTTTTATRRQFLAGGAGGVATVTAAAPVVVVAAAAAPTARVIARPRATLVSSQPGGPKTYLLVFDKDAEGVTGLRAFAKHERLVAGQLSGIGAVSDAVLAFFDRIEKDYARIPVDRQAEVTSLTGNLALKDGSPFLHVH